MKVVVASTPEQEQHIDELIHYMYSSIFPSYFDDEYIMKLEELNVLAPKEDDIYFSSTLDKAFKVISSLQVIIAVLETVRFEGFQGSHKELFVKNVKILNEFGYSFPFTPSEFKVVNSEVLSKYSKPANQYLA